MRKGRFSEEQMVAIIREADRDPVAAVAKRHGISEQTIWPPTRKGSCAEAGGAGEIPHQWSIVGLGIHPVAVFASASSSASRAYSSAWPNVHSCLSEIINRRSTVAALASISTMT